MNKMTPYSPVASCALAIGALALALLSWAGILQMLQPALALTSVTMTIASFALAIVGILAFRRGPRPHVVAARVGLALSCLPILFWGLLLWIYLSLDTNPF